jgi:class III poly(R)-hydroxyalkanoic acid synthase PhaE subunit
MTDGERNGEWIGGWIEQQRRLLDTWAAADGAGVDAAWRDLGRKWLDAGQSYLQGWAQFVSGTTPSPEAAAAGDELFRAWQAVPPLGLAREHTDGWREVVAAQAECKRLESELRAVLTRVQSDALALLERRVSELREAGKSLDSYREIYDLWVECGEKVYAEVAHSEPYCKLQAEMGNATMRLRTRLQAVIESGLRQLDLPTRSELNTVHRQVRELRERVAELEKHLEASRRGSSS